MGRLLGIFLCLGNHTVYRKGRLNMSNHLKDEGSPYLLQHAENPVDWYPWCREAFEKARKEDKPIFLSIGYSTCHWCHVMAHESFEDSRTAHILNRFFVSIKVDREERPDIDSVYMAVCQAFTGSGGWPMSIFMTWDKKPFFAGTYFPVHSRYGRPGFSELLRALADRWTKGRRDLLNSADEIIAGLRQGESLCDDKDHENLAEKALQIFSDGFDEINGGFGAAPKFPAPHNLLFLMLYAGQKGKPDILGMAKKTLAQMYKGGIFDHIGGGFSRYSTDKYYLAPHFEKMLYDNAWLVTAYAGAYEATADPLYLDIAEKTAAYVIREMTSPEGGFYSGQDADSEGVEGKYYTFTWKEIMDVLGEEEGKEFAGVFDITPEGNFEGVNIPNLLRSSGGSADFDRHIQRLYEYRRNRCRLHVDDKILTSWNSMMAGALAVLYRASKNENYLLKAIETQQFIEKNLCEGTCLYTSRRGRKRSEKGFLDDYAYYIAALTELYHSTLDKSYVERAEELCREAVNRFADEKTAGYCLSDSDSTELFMNPKETYDGAVPSGNSMMAYNLVRLYQLTEKHLFKELAEKQISYMSAQARNYPAGYAMFLFAKLIYENPPVHMVIALKDSRDLEGIKGRLPLLANVTVASETRDYPLMNDRTTFYICRDGVCFPPVNEIMESIAIPSQIS